MNSVDYAISQSQMLTVLARLHNVVPARMSALKGRLQHFQRLGFPYGVNTGKGRAARYEASQIVELVLAFELSQLGLWPEAVLAAIQSLGERLPRALGRLDLSKHRERHFDIIVVFDANALSDLTREYGERRATTQIDLMTLDQVSQFVEDLGDLKRRMALVNLSASLASAKVHLDEIIGESSILDGGIQIWSDAAELPDYRLEAPQ